MWKPSCLLCAFLLSAFLCAIAAEKTGAELTAFESKGKWGYKDTRGRIVIPARYEVAQPFLPEGIAAVADQSGWAYIDAQGREVIRPFIFDNGPDYFHEGLARFVAQGRFGFFDRHGKVAIPARFDFALPFAEGLAAFCAGCKEVSEGEHKAMRGGRWGFMDRQGEVVIPAKFEEARGFEKGRARVKLGGRWGFVDPSGAFKPA
ncbi:MAG: WG repeat-containing protein [Acidobacteria bacterium]|nr:WG repeat-containing protein [Acidobacteriota bacterium]